MKRLMMTMAAGALVAMLAATGVEAQTVKRTVTETTMVPLPTDSLVRIRLLDTIDSRNWKEGDQFPYEVSQDVIVDGRVAIPAGTRGVGVVTRARKAGSFGKEGKIELSFGSIQVAGGRTVELVLSEKARQGNDKEHLAAGASLAGLAVAGPIGLIGGLFVKGKNVTVPAGSEMYVATSAAISDGPAPVHTTTRVETIED